MLKSCSKKEGEIMESCNYTAMMNMSTNTINFY